MSQQNVEKAKQALAAYNRRDFDAAVEFFDPEIEWVLPPSVRADSCHGPEDVKRFWREVDEELFHHLIAFRDGRIVRIEHFTDWAEARTAASPGDRIV
jgi:ketosteroid isomerase-like protein